jgi:hypothetical protein
MESEKYRRFELDLPRKVRKYQKLKEKKRYYKDYVRKLTEELEGYRGTVQDMKMREFDTKLDMMDRLARMDKTMNRGRSPHEQSRFNPRSPFGHH